MIALLGAKITFWEKKIRPLNQMKSYQFHIILQENK